MNARAEFSRGPFCQEVCTRRTRISLTHKAEIAVRVARKNIEASRKSIPGRVLAEATLAVRLRLDVSTRLLGKLPGV
jgi:hypothetical protein